MKKKLYLKELSLPDSNLIFFLRHQPYIFFNQRTCKERSFEYGTKLSGKFLLFNYDSYAERSSSMAPFLVKNDRITNQKGKQERF